jgi:hypothetical protein
MDGNDARNKVQLSSNVDRRLDRFDAENLNLSLARRPG